MATMKKGGRDLGLIELKTTAGRLLEVFRFKNGKGTRTTLPAPRFARSMAHLLHALEEFRSLGVNFVSFTEGIDTTTSMGKFVFGVFSSLAEFERSLISERVRNGM